MKVIGTGTLQIISPDVQNSLCQIYVTSVPDIPIHTPNPALPIQINEFQG